MFEILPVVLALFLVLGLMVAAVWLMKQLTRKISGRSGGKGIQVVTCAGIGQDRTLMAVRAGKKNLLLGVTAGGVSLICELDNEDMEIIESSEAVPMREEMAGKSFSECLRYNVRRMGADFIRPYGSGKDGQDGEDKPEI